LYENVHEEKYHKYYCGDKGQTRYTCFTAFTLTKRLWFGEQDISQNRFKKFLKQAGHPTRNGIACKSEVAIYHKLKFLSTEQRHLE
jgi:hypothetical protein